MSINRSCCRRLVGGLYNNISRWNPVIIGIAVVIVFNSPGPERYVSGRQLRNYNPDRRFYYDISFVRKFPVINSPVIIIVHPRNGYQCERQGQKRTDIGAMIVVVHRAMMYRRPVFSRSIGALCEDRGAGKKGCEAHDKKSGGNF
ncbi:MAG: hypothetical protein KAT81_05915 [Syntrophobacterales bacterium]|nr:hypothetical protein [Syntrophobacterales bacterium]